MSWLQSLITSGGKPNADFGSQIYGTDYGSYLKADGSLDTYNVNDHLNKIAAGSKTLEDFNFAKLGTDTDGKLFEEGKHDGVYGSVEGKSDLLVIKQFMNRFLLQRKGYFEGFFWKNTSVG